MKKSIILLSGAGIAAGLAIALTNTKRKNRQFKTSEEGERPGDEFDNDVLTAQAEESVESSPSAKASLANDEDQKAASMKSLHEERESVNASGKVEIDDHGTDQETASAILERVRDQAFDSSDEKLAIALGRPTEEITRWLDGSEIIDGDVLLKVRALAMERGVEVPAAAAPSN